MKVPKESVPSLPARGVVVPTLPCGVLSLPLAAPLDAQLLAVLVPIPDQQLTAWPNHSAGPVEDLPVILKGHQVLLLVIPGTVHIPGLRQERV